MPVLISIDISNSVSRIPVWAAMASIKSVSSSNAGAKVGISVAGIWPLIESSVEVCNKLHANVNKSMNMRESNRRFSELIIIE